ncbi:MAG: hypothetical protein HOP29_03430 [Phycisphaerales bacterium]|nr:hypothetical protein [Phycisphaerales bacterium]
MTSIAQPAPVVDPSETEIAPAESDNDAPSAGLSRWESYSFEITRGFLYLIARVISLTGLYQVGRMFGIAEWLVDYHRRRRVTRQVVRLIGTSASPAAVRQAVRRHFIRLRCDKMFYLIMDRLPRKRLMRRLTIANRAVLDSALARGHGVYLALSHLGSLYVTIGILVEFGYRVAGIRATKFGAVWRFVQTKLDQKDRPRIEYFYSNTFPRPIYRRLNDNYIVASLADVHVVKDGRQRTVEVDLFDERRSILAGPFQIAMRCGSPIVQAMVRALPNFRYEIELMPLLPDPSAVRAHDSTVAVAADQPPRADSPTARTPSSDDRAASSDDRPASSDLLADTVRRYAANVERFGRRYPCHLSRY